MNDIIKEILPIVIQLMAAAISMAAAIYVPILLKKLNRKLGISLNADEESQFEDIVKEAMLTVEQVSENYKIDGIPCSSANKKNNARKRIISELATVGAQKTSSQIDDKIEAVFMKYGSKFGKWLSKI